MFWRCVIEGGLAMSKKKFPDPPPEVEETVKQYVRKGEDYHIFRPAIKFNDVLYHYCKFAKGKTRSDGDEELSGFLIVRDDGVVPPKTEEVISILRLGLHTNTMTFDIAVTGREWASLPIQMWEKLMSLLRKVGQAFQSEMPEEIREALSVFKETAETMSREQKLLQEHVSKAMKLAGEVTIVTPEIGQKIADHFDGLLEAKRNQHMAMLNSTQDRTKLLNYLARRIPFWHLRWWWIYLQLKKYHKLMTFTKEEIKDLQTAEEEGPPKRARENTFRKEMLPLLRNPSP